MGNVSNSREQIKHAQHFALSTNVFNNVKKSKSIQNVSTQEKNAGGFAR